MMHNETNRKRRSLVERQLESNFNEKMTKLVPGINGTRRSRSNYSPFYVPNRKRKIRSRTVRIDSETTTPIRLYQSSNSISAPPRLTVPVRISAHNYYPKGPSLMEKWLERSRKIANDPCLNNGNAEDDICNHPIGNDSECTNTIEAMLSSDTHESLSMLLSNKMAQYSSVNDIVDLTVDSDGENIPGDCAQDSSRQNSEQSVFDMIDNSDDVVIVETGMPVGTIVWARLGSFPYWPAFVYRNEESTEDKIHVKFLGDNGRVSFVTEDRIMPFEGIAKFREYARSIKVSRSIRKRMFAVKTKKWDMAVCEANLLQQINLVHRTVFHDQVLFNALYNKSSRSDTASIASGSAYRPSSTPCTIDTAYSSMKQSPIAHIDDYPMNDINGNTDDLNVSMIESDALSAGGSILPASREGSTASGYDDRCPHSGADEYLSIVKHLAANIMKDHQYKTFEVVHSDEFKEAFGELWKLKELEVTSKLKSLKMSTMDTSEKRVASKRRAEADGGPDSGPRAKRERRNLSVSSSNRSGVASPQLPTPKHIWEEQAAREAKERMLKELERQEMLNQRIDNCIIKKYSSNYLFRSCAKGPVCNVCSKTENVVRCSGPCALFYHGKCAGEEHLAKPKIRLITGEGAVYDKQSVQAITCRNCRLVVSVTPKCYACDEEANATNTLIRCVEKQCNKYYHEKCLKYWPQGKYNVNTGAYSCPYHMCQTCESDDVRSSNNHESDRNLIKCIKCPASYHRITSCVPAGSKLLSDASLICPRHRVYKKKPVNANWCFFCGKFGNLVCCETCPATYHYDCLLELKLDPGDRYICEFCESGRLPLYGEIVWAKYGFHKWWPAIIVPPWQIPANVLRSSQTNYFCVCFFGKRKEYGWMCKDTVYRYEEGDSEFDQSHALKDTDYRQAIQEAKEFFRIIEATPAMYKNPKKSQTKPNQFRRIKFNKPVPPVRFEDLETSDTECKCLATDENPCSRFSDCLNQHTFIECRPNCKAGENCQNQRFEKCLYPRLEVRKVDGKGFGLFNVEDIPEGTFIIEYVGEVINLEEFHRRFERLKQQKSDTYYMLSIDGSLFIDAGPKGNDARFINHSCEPNSIPQKWTVKGVTRIGFFANCHIKSGTEITFDYNWCKIPGNSGVALTPCYCGSRSCAGFIGAKKQN